MTASREFCSPHTRGLAHAETDVFTPPPHETIYQPTCRLQMPLKSSASRLTQSIETGQAQRSRAFQDFLACTALALRISPTPGKVSQPAPLSCRWCAVQHVAALSGFVGDRVRCFTAPDVVLEEVQGAACRHTYFQTARSSVSAHPPALRIGSLGCLYSRWCPLGRWVGTWSGCTAAAQAQRVGVVSMGNLPTRTLAILFHHTSATMLLRVQSEIAFRELHILCI